MPGSLLVTHPELFFLGKPGQIYFSDLFFDRPYATVDQLGRKVLVFAWLICHKELATGIMDSAFDHQVFAHFKILNGMAQFVQVGGACQGPR